MDLRALEALCMGSGQVSTNGAPGQQMLLLGSGGTGAPDTAVAGSVSPLVWIEPFMVPSSVS